MNTNNEIWKFIPNTKERYQVSNLGNVKSLTNLDKIVIMKTRTDPRGYQMVNLWVEGKRKTYRLHILVMLAFYGATPKGKEIDHKDGNKKNNTKDNLQYLSSRENVTKAQLKCKSSNLPTGVRVGSATTYSASIRYKKERYYLGTEKTPKLAHERYLAALEQINNGTFEINNFRANYNKRQNSTQTQPKQNNY